MQANETAPHDPPADPASRAALYMPFDNSYARDLEGMYARSSPAGSPAPRLLRLNRNLAEELGLDADEMSSAAGLAMLAGNAVPALAQPLAQAPTLLALPPT